MHFCGCFFGFFHEDRTIPYDPKLRTTFRPIRPVQAATVVQCEGDIRGARQPSLYSGSLVQREGDVREAGKARPTDARTVARCRFC